MRESRDTFFIGGTWVAPHSDRRFTLVNPSTGEQIGTVPEAGREDVDSAVAAAREAFDSGEWPRLAPAERAEVMDRFLAAIVARSTDLARAVSIQNGMPIAISGALEAGFGPGVVQYYAQLARQMGQRDVRPSQMGKETLVERSPIGVAAAIVPWNFPVTLALNKIAPAMAAGCTMVIKPSPGTVLDCYLLAEAAEEAGVPAGVLNWVPADRDVGAYLVSHPGVDKVAFTGSTGAGRKIAATCGELLRPVTLELGGKSAAILLDDADLGTFLQGAPMATMLNNGQACFNGSRILAPRRRYDEVVGALAELTSRMTVGDALDPETQMGPAVTEDQMETSYRYIEIARAEGGRVVTGGERLTLEKPGWYVQPTLIRMSAPVSAIRVGWTYQPGLSSVSRSPPVTTRPPSARAMSM